MRKILGLIFFVTLSSVYAATQPKFLFVPQTSTAMNLPTNGVATVAYQVTNQTQVTRTLTMVGIKGVTPITTGAGVCSNPFTLASKQSCILKFSIAGSQIPPSIVEGPEVCAIQGRGNNNPNPFLCSQPSQADSLKIIRTLAERPLLSVTPTSFIFTAADQTQTFTVTNNSTTVTALAISANFTNTALDGNMSQNSAACASVLPGASCDLLLTSGANAVSTTAVPIQGSNTKKVGVRLTAAIPQTALLMVSPNNLILQATNGTPVSQTMLVTNVTPNTTASNIHADFTGTALEGKVTPTTCAGPIAYNETCTLTFTPGTQAVQETFFNIKADSNSITTLVEASIAVNEASQINLTVAGSPMTLYANGGVPPDGVKDMTITNTSTTETAYDVTANLGELGAAVSVSTCTSIAPQDSCLLTFESNTSTAPATDVDIQGTNTNATEVNITVKRVSYLYVVDFGTNRVIQCTVDLTSGALSACVNTGTVSSTPVGLSLGLVYGKAYVVNNGGNSITTCDITPVTGGLTNCSNAAIGSISGLNERGPAINSENTILYVANVGSNTTPILSCPLVNGIYSANSCTAPTPSGASAAAGIALNSTDSFIYQVNSGVSKYCSVATDGTLSNCLGTGATELPSTASSVAITADGQYAYIAGSGGITGYAVTGGGTLFTSPSAFSFSGIGTGNGIVVSAGGDKVFISTASQNVVVCDVGAGVISSCSTMSVSSNASTQTFGLALLD